jgi:hypothetical protein
MGLVREFFERRFGIARSELKAFESPESLKASLSNYALQVGDFQQRLQEWQKTPEAERSGPPQPDDFIDELLVKLVVGDLLGFHINAFDGVEVKIKLPVEPFLTNGEWDREGLHATWTHTVERTGTPSDTLPAFSYAAWAVADEEFQRRHFGAVVLQHADLGEYVLWRAALTTSEAAEWDAFVNSLAPGQELVAQLKQFRFSADRQPEGDELPASLADQPRGLLLKAFKSAE